ncbi:DUF362 domain-containing protein [candidate division KSB1 bacterium]|nr:DUF362 domain-containing protein [candidate division KSB1 bacterium]
MQNLESSMQNNSSDRRKFSFDSHRIIDDFLRQNSLPLIGIISLFWFLIRVLPKPSRAFYPCQRVAFPIASSFVIWILSVFSSLIIVNKVRTYFRNSRLKYTLAGVIILLFALGLILFDSPTIPLWADDEPFQPIDKPNQPIGTAQGKYPGRVVWAHNTDATNWNGTGTWSDDAFTEQNVVNNMLSQSLLYLSGAENEKAAWEALFRYFNKNHGKGDAAYQIGEKIAVKLNLNACTTHRSNGNKFYTSPQVTLALLQQLVEIAGVPEQNITFYDATRYIPEEIYDKCKSQYPKVIFADFEGGDGRKQIQRDLAAEIKYSQELILEPGGGNATYVPKCVSQADYLINLGHLKGHNLAGITLGAKNWFGSIVSYPANDNPESSSPRNAGLHPYICVHSDFHFGGHWDFNKRAMGTYNVLVDLMGHQQLGAKTMLYIIDGLYAAPDQSTVLKKDHKWRFFNDDWPNSLFVSQDPVAIESVCLDFLQSEPGQIWVRGNVDNYLHEAALANNPPSGTKYDPEQDGSTLTSLGVHEHWNNAQEKMYSRNLGTGNGIELVRAGDVSSVDNSADIVPSMFQLVQNYPNPFMASTTIQYEIKKESLFTIKVYDVRGRLVAKLFEGVKPSGRYEQVWNGTDVLANKVPSGIYFIGLSCNEMTVYHRITLLR